MSVQTQSSAMFAAKQALVDVLDSHQDLAGVQVSWAHPGKNLTKEVVIVGDIRPREQKPVDLSSRQRECAFTIDVAIDASQRSDAKTVAERTTEIAATVEEVVALNPELGLPETILYAQVVSAGLTEGFDDPGREALVELVVNVRARLRRS